MAGFYERMKEAWNSIKDGLRLGRAEGGDSYDELCRRLRSGKPIEAEELDRIGQLCKLIAEPRCGKRIEEGIETLKRIAATKEDSMIGRKRKRGEEECGSGDEGKGIDVRKVKKRRRRRYQGKDVMKKEDDVSWGVLPKKYRTEGKTGVETIERAIGYDKEENLFLHLGEVSSSEEEKYFCEKNVARLNSGPGERQGVRCNFGGEYNCKSCVEYEVRKEYESRERERAEEEKKRSEERRKAAKERWEAKVPRSYFYLEKELGVGRAVTRYVTDDKFDIEDLESGEKEKLGRVLSQAKKGQLFDIDRIEEKKTSFGEKRNEESEIRAVSEGEKSEEIGGRGVDGHGEPDRAVAGVGGAGVFGASTRMEAKSMETAAEEKAAPAIGKEGASMPQETPFVFGGMFEKPMSSGEQGRPEETPKRFGFWDGKMPSVDGRPAAFQFGGGSGFGGSGGAAEERAVFQAQDSPSSVNHENVSSPFAADIGIPETKPFMGGDGLARQSDGSMEGLGAVQPAAELGASLFKRKLGVFGEGQGTPKPSFSFGASQGSGEAFQMPSMGAGGQGASLFGGAGQPQGGGQQPVGGNIFGNGASLFGSFLGESGSSQQPAKPSIGYADPGEKSGAGSSGMFGSGIFHVADDDPFEKGSLGGRR